MKMSKAKQDIYILVEYDDVADYLQEEAESEHGARGRHKKVP
jgi:hypothetical protein